MQDSASYTVRKSVLESARTWTVDENGLSWSAPDSSGRLAFSDMRAIRLDWSASRFDTARHTVRVSGRTGTAAAIVSTSYKGIGNFSDQAECFVPFVRALIGLAHRANPHCEFWAGASPVKYAGNVLALAAGVLALAAVLLTIGSPLTGLIAMKILLIVFLAPLGVRWLIVNWPRRFDPRQIPADLLPGG